MTPLLTGRSPIRQLPGPTADEIAYIIYTSGTTGTPKGVAIPHRNVTRLLETLDADMDLAGQVWSQCHSLAFDFSVWEIWGALLYGGRVVVVPDAVVRSPEDLHALLVAEAGHRAEPDPVGVLCAAGRRCGAARVGPAAQARGCGVRRGSA